MITLSAAGYGRPGGPGERIPAHAPLAAHR